MRAANKTDAGSTLGAEPLHFRALTTLSELARDAWDFVVGPSGWRSVIGPMAFVIAAAGLLVYDHLNRRVSDVIFWLTLALIVTVFLRMIETNRRQSRELEQQRLSELNDQVTGLNNRRQLEADIEATVAATGEERILVLLELDGLQAYNDRYGFAAGDDLLRNVASQLLDTVAPLDGGAYRLAASRLAVLVPSGHSSLGEIILAATGSLRSNDNQLLIGSSYGEVTIPRETDDVEAAIQIAGQRLALHKQRQHGSARRQAQSVLMATLGARHAELRDELRLGAYRAISLARRLGVERDQIDDIAMAAELRCIGLLSVPEVVIENESRLELDDPTAIRSYPLEGESIISAAPGLAPVAALVRATCERFDGGGYPDGLAGEAIPIGARIIAVAGAFAAMTSSRSFRGPYGVEAAMAELKRHTGSRFDPRVLDALDAELSEEASPTAA